MMHNILTLIAMLFTFQVCYANNTAVPDSDPKSNGTQSTRTSVPKKDQISFDNMNPERPWNSQYKLGQDSQLQDGIPHGKITKHRFVSQVNYPGVGRDYWLYVPKQYDGNNPVCLMVFQDGETYLGPEMNVPAVFDNLIYKGDLPVMIGLFVNPGDKGPGTPIYGGNNNRSVEYDSLGDRYARFLIDELLPAIQQDYMIVSEPAGRAICGFSSGGICAFTVAWERPDTFSKVVSHCGSFVSIQRGHTYPSIIRGTERKPIRVFLQSGSHDLDIVFGNWPLANKQMASALKYRDYDCQFIFGEEGHSLKHGGAVFPDTLRWLWRDYHNNTK